MATVSPVQKVIPGPRAVPLLSWRANLPSLFRDPFTYMRHLHNTYGSLVSVARGNPAYVFAFGPEFNFQLLAHPDLFETSAAFISNLPQDTALGRLLLNNLPLLNGGPHRQQRRLMQPSFHRKHIMLYHEDMVGLTQRLLDDWQLRSEVNVLSEMRTLTQRMVIKILFGLDDVMELDRISVLLQQLTSISPFTLVLRVNIPGLPYHRILHLAEQVELLTRAMIEQKRTQPDASDILAVLSRAHDEDGATMSEDELIGNVFALFSAGHETTSIALTWTLFLLNQHPHIFSNLLDELEGALHGNAPTIEQLSRLPLLEGVIKETLRLLPPASIGIRVTTAPCELGGFVLPAGSNVLYSQFITHRLPELYEEPDRFKPERWATLNRTPYEYLPFSAGQHRCIGAEFAMQEMKVVLAMVLQRYRLAIIPHTKFKIGFRMSPFPRLLMHIHPQDRQFQRVAVHGNINQLIDFS